MINRRLFLKQSASLAAAWVADPAWPAVPSRSPFSSAPTLHPDSLAHFVDPLPIPPVARRSGLRPDPSKPSQNIPYYRIEMKAFESPFHRDLKPAKQWGYDAMCPGPNFETRTGEPVLVEWVNSLPAAHFLPIDHKLHGAESSKPEVRAVVHLHGGKAPPESDGYPENWYVPGKSALYYYPNNQDAAMLWYHDHTLGINRLNMYAGLFGAFVIRDSAEDSLNLPRGSCEIPLVIYDRMLGEDGQLQYPVSSNPQSPWIPEFFGDAILVNGKLFPYLNVEPRKYRFRVLNGSNARFYHLSLSSGQSFHHIGTDQGLLPAPVEAKSFVIAPGERVDIVVDFSASRGQQIILKNESFVLMQFRVSDAPVADPSSLPSVLRPFARIPESQAARTRPLSLDEYDNLVAEPILMLLNKSYWRMPISERPVLNSTEIWSFINPTDDAHPIHLHLVRFQILDRRRFEPSVFIASRQVKFTGPVVPPEPNEAGWKDTVRVNPRTVTRIIVRFEGFVGRYVWHCHILEHEDNEMMRPFEVVPA